MFYDALGGLLTHAAVTLSEVRPHVTDDAARTQLDAVAAVCEDIGAMWPALFAALAEENRIMEKIVGSESLAADELTRYRQLSARLSRELDVAHGCAAGDGAARLEQLRTGLSAAAGVQEALVASAMVSGRNTVKRV